MQTKGGQMRTVRKKMWTDADNKCGQDRDPLHAKSNGMVPYGIIHLRSGERARYFEVIKLALLSM